MCLGVRHYLLQFIAITKHNTLDGGGAAVQCVYTRLLHTMIFPYFHRDFFSRPPSNLILPPRLRDARYFSDGWKLELGCYRGSLKKHN